MLIYCHQHSLEFELYFLQQSLNAGVGGGKGRRKEKRAGLRQAFFSILGGLCILYFDTANYALESKGLITYYVDSLLRSL